MMEERRETEQSRSSISQHPREMRGRSGGFFKHARIALDEEDVEDELETEGAEIDKGGQEAPVLERERIDQPSRLLIC